MDEVAAAYDGTIAVGGAVVYFSRQQRYSRAAGSDIRKRVRNR